MYDPVALLAMIDRHWVGILLLCSGAMICNYAWFISAVRRGLRDRVYPMPIVSVLFWLTGDATVVVRWLSGHDAYDHWYLRLFSLSLTLTVVCELIFLAMILKFGAKEWMPGRSRLCFGLWVFAALTLMLVSWNFLVGAMHDPLNITYFLLANMIGPPASAALAIKRGNRAGTSPAIWAGYAAMLAFFYCACLAFYGPPYDQPAMMLYFAINVVAALAVLLLVCSLPGVDTIRDGDGNAVPPN